MGIRTQGFTGLRIHKPIWRHLITVFLLTIIVYVGYEFTESETLSTVPASHVTSHVNYTNYLMERNKFLQSMISSSGSTSSSTCPVHTPVLQVLDHEDAMVQYIPCTRIIYNRVPKCGSRSLIAVFRELARRYNFTVEANRKPESGKNYYKDFNKFKSFVYNFTTYEDPMIYTQHIHFVNFTKFGLDMPVFINVIRDPIQRLISHYYYNMFGSQSRPLETPNPKFQMNLDDCVNSRQGACLNINTVIPFFCGHEPHCKIRDSRTLQKAKRTVRESYLVVGITEDLSGFMEILETLAPQFFFNGSQVYKEKEQSLHKLYQTVKKPTVSEETIEVLKDHLSLEIDFYQFIKQRYYTILSKVRAIKKVKLKEKKFLKWWETT